MTSVMRAMPPPTDEMALKSSNPNRSFPVRGTYPTLLIGYAPARPRLVTLVGDTSEPRSSPRRTYMGAPGPGTRTARCGCRWHAAGGIGVDVEYVDNVAKAWVSDVVLAPGEQAETPLEQARIWVAVAG
jgi:hypothetical protein